MLKNYLKIAYKVLLRRKFYTAVSLFGIAFTLLILNVCVAFMDHFFAATAPDSRLGRMLTVETAQMFGESFSSSSRPGYALLDRYARDLPGVEAMSIASDPDRVTAFVDGEKLIIWQARPLERKIRFLGRPGQIVKIVPGEGVWVLTGDGILVLEFVQPEGGEEVRADSFIRSIQKRLGFDVHEELYQLRKELHHLKGMLKACGTQTREKT